MENIPDFLVPLEFLVPVALASAVATYLEWQFPRRDVDVPVGRWLTTLMLYLLAILLGMLILPVFGFAVARATEAAGTGLLNLIALPVWLKAVLTVLILDFISFGIHWLMHRYPWLWRLHRVHHSDNIVSASTSLLHHPLEVVALQLVGVLATPFFGLQAEGLLIFTGVQFVFNIWHHANIASFPGQFWLGYIVYTPEEHRVHHSAEARHYNCNLGLIFTFWDRLFATFIKDRDLDRRIRYGLDPEEWDHPDTIASLMVESVPQVSSGVQWAIFRCRENSE